MNDLVNVLVNDLMNDLENDLVNDLEDDLITGNNAHTTNIIANYSIRMWANATFYQSNCLQSPETAAKSDFCAEMDRASAAPSDAA